MTDVLDQFWRAYLYSNNGSLSGMAVTLWLLVLSVTLGFFISIVLAVARVSSRRWLSVPLWLFSYVFRGTPLYVQLLFIYVGIYSLDDRYGSKTGALPILDSGWNRLCSENQLCCDYIRVNGCRGCAYQTAPSGSEHKVGVCVAG